MIRLISFALIAVVYSVAVSADSAGASTPIRRNAGALHAMHSRVRSAASASSPLPTDVPNLSLWLDAADASTLVASNGKLSLWHDKSGGGNDVSQANATAQPSIVSAALNGLANIGFNGFSSYLASSTAFTHDLYPASTTFVVATGVSTSAWTSALWSGGSITGFPRWGYGIPSYSAVRLFFGSQSDQLTYPSSINVTAPAIYDGGESVTTQQGFINYNGTREGAIAGNITGDNGTNPLAIGARFVASPAQLGGYYKGNVAEVLVYSALLSTTQTQQIEGYLACKWGLQAALPANHPYRNSCSGARVDVDTYHNDNLRTGWNANETLLTPANVGTSSFGLLMNLPMDGLTFTQPLVAASEPIPAAGSHDLVIAGTNNDSLYAFEANTGATVWKRSFANGTTTTTVGIAFTGCDNTGQQDGLLSTPVIDRATDTVYVVAATMEPHHIHFRLHALSLATGADKIPNVEIGGSFIAPNGTTETFNADVQFQRPALLEADGNIYIAFGSQCDFKLNQYHGWVFGYSASNFARIGVADVTPTASWNGTQFAAGIWMSGEGLSSDASGSVYFSTGNGTFDGSNNFGESVLRLSPSLSMNGLTSASYFTPASVFSDNGSDRDLGSGGVMLLPDQPFATPHVAVVQGKEGILTLLNRDNLGGYKAGGPDNALAELNLGSVWAAPAYWQDASSNAYVLTTGGPLYLVQVGSRSLAVVGQTSVTFPSDNGNGSTPSVSSNGTTAGTAVVWIVRNVSNASTDQNYLFAFDPTRLGTTLFSASLGGWPQNDLNPTLVPTIANGKVYVPTQNSIAVFGLH